MTFEPRFLATAIGSLPHADPGEACRLMINSFPEATPWPQLPARSFLENMYVQFSEGMPGIVVDIENRNVYFDVDGSFHSELEEFYRAFSKRDIDFFRISPEFAAGLSEFIGGAFTERLSGSGFVKGQITGPISFGLTVTDRYKKASLYDVTLEQIITGSLALKGAWQVEKLREAIPGARVILFIDEPYLVSVGSALLSVSRDQVVEDINLCLKECGSDLRGIHCCGNTDWSIVFELDMEIVNFDAFDYMEGFTAYDREISKHLFKGGAIAWGIVPNDERVLDITHDDLIERIEEAFSVLEKRGLDRGTLAARSMITPACGLGSVDVRIARRSLEMTGEVSALLRERYFE